MFEREAREFQLYQLDYSNTIARIPSLESSHSNVTKTLTPTLEHRYWTHDGILDSHVEFKNVDEIQGFKSSSFDQLLSFGAQDYWSGRCDLVYLECSYDVILCGESGVRHIHSVFLCDLQSCEEKVDLEVVSAFSYNNIIIKNKIKFALR